MVGFRLFVKSMDVEDSANKFNKDFTTVFKQNLSGEIHASVTARIEDHETN